MISTPYRSILAVTAALTLTASPALAAKFDPTAPDATAATPRQAARITAARFATIIDGTSVVGPCVTHSKTMTTCRARTTGKVQCRIRIWVQAVTGHGYYYTRVDQVRCRG